MLAQATPATTHFLARDEGRVAYDVTGHGPLVILVPGIGDLRQQYRFLAPQLAAAGYTAVTMDQRGMGESSTGWPDYSAAASGSDILSLIEELDAGPAHLVGNSSAAGSAVWVAAEAPGRVASLTLIGPFVRDIPPNPLQTLLMWGMINVGLARPWGAAVWGTYYTSLYPTSKPRDMDAYVQRLRTNVKEAGRLEAIQAMFRASKSDVEARLARVQTRTLVVMGSKDPDFAGVYGGPAAEARLVADRLHGNVLMVDGAGHYPHAEMPEQVAPAIIDFLQLQLRRHCRSQRAG